MRTPKKSPELQAFLEAHKVESDYLTSKFFSLADISGIATKDASKEAVEAYNVRAKAFTDALVAAGHPSGWGKRLIQGA